MVQNRLKLVFAFMNGRTLETETRQMCSNLNTCAMEPHAHMTTDNNLEQTKQKSQKFCHFHKIF